MKRVVILIMMAVFSVASISACNTIAGMGKDVQAVGSKVSDKAQDCKDAHC